MRCSGGGPARRRKALVSRAGYVRYADVFLIEKKVHALKTLCRGYLPRRLYESVVVRLTTS